MKNLMTKIFSKLILSFSIILLFLQSFSLEQGSHFFLSPSYNINTSYVIDSFTQNSEFLTID